MRSTFDAIDPVPETVTNANTLEKWRSSLLVQPLDRLRALAENYLGGGTNPTANKNEIVDRLMAQLAKPEVVDAALTMIDDLDALILGCIAIVGGIPKSTLQRALASSLNYFDLEYRLANLSERLLVYEDRDGLLQVVPLFEAAFTERFANPTYLFGTKSLPKALARARVSSFKGLSVIDLSLVLYSFLRYEKKAFLKSGVLANRVRERLQKLLDADSQTMAVLDEIVRALGIAGILKEGEQGLSLDTLAFKHFLLEHGRNYPFALAVILTLPQPTGEDSARLAAGSSKQPRSNGPKLLLESTNFLQTVRSLSEAVSPYFEVEFRFSSVGIERFSSLFLPLGSLAPQDPIRVQNEAGFPGHGYFIAMQELDLIRQVEDGWICNKGRAFGRRPLASYTIAGDHDVQNARDRRKAIIEGTGSIHVLPEAPVEDLLALLDLAQATSISDSWDLEITKETAKLAFAEGQTAASMLATLSRLCGVEPPQSLCYNLATWEEEYNALVFYKGSVLAVDATTSRILEQSGAINSLPFKKIRDGIYFIGSVPYSTIEQMFERLGLPAPSLVVSAKSGKKKEQVSTQSSNPSPLDQAQKLGGYPGPDYSQVSQVSQAGNVAAISPSLQGRSLPENQENPEAPKSPDAFESELLDALQTRTLPEPIQTLLEERIRRKLIYSKEQLQSLSELLLRRMGADKNAEFGAKTHRRLSLGTHSAGGLDFQGKLHIIQSALKSRFCKLEIRWTSGGTTKSTTVRPVKLTRTADDWMLIGEDLATGQAVGIRVGSISQIRQEKGFLLGDE